MLDENSFRAVSFGGAFYVCCICILFLMVLGVSRCAEWILRDKIGTDLWCREEAISILIGTVGQSVAGSNCLDHND